MNMVCTSNYFLRQVVYSVNYSQPIIEKIDKHYLFFMIITENFVKLYFISWAIWHLIASDVPPSTNHIDWVIILDIFWEIFQAIKIRQENTVCKISWKSADWENDALLLKLTRSVVMYRT